MNRWWCHDFHSNWVSSFLSTVPFRVLILDDGVFFVFFWFAVSLSLFSLSIILFYLFSLTLCEVERIFSKNRIHFDTLDTCALVKCLPKEMHTYHIIWTYTISFILLCVMRLLFFFSRIVFIWRLVSIYSRIRNTWNDCWICLTVVSCLLSKRVGRTILFSLYYQF